VNSRTPSPVLARVSGMSTVCPEPTRPCSAAGWTSMIGAASPTPWRPDLDHRRERVVGAQHETAREGPRGAGREGDIERGDLTRLDLEPAGTRLYTDGSTSIGSITRRALPRFASATRSVLLMVLKNAPEVERRRLALEVRPREDRERHRDREGAVDRVIGDHEDVGLVVARRRSRGTKMDDEALRRIGRDGSGFRQDCRREGPARAAEASVSAVPGRAAALSITELRNVRSPAPVFASVSVRSPPPRSRD